MDMRTSIPGLWLWVPLGGVGVSRNHGVVDMRVRIGAETSAGTGGVERVGYGYAA